MFWKKSNPVVTDPTPREYYSELPSFTLGDVTSISNAMQVDGFALVKGVLSKDLIFQARQKIDELRPLHWDFNGLTDHYKNVFNRDPFWLTFLDLPGIIEVAEANLGENCHIIGQTAWRSYPGHRGVGVHLDYLPMTWPEGGIPDGMIVPIFLCTAHFYLSPQPRELCPTQVIPGSHRAGRKPTAKDFHWRGRLLQPVLCEAGDVLLFRSDLWHSGSDNQTTDQTRYLLQVHYGRREMAQHFSPFLQWSFNPEVLHACSARQRRLLGDHRQGAYD